MTFSALHLWMEAGYPSVCGLWVCSQGNPRTMGFKGDDMIFNSVSSWWLPDMMSLIGRVLCEMVCYQLGWSNWQTGRLCFLLCFWRPPRPSQLHGFLHHGTRRASVFCGAAGWMDKGGRRSSHWVGWSGSERTRPLPPAPFPPSLSYSVI